ncbi:unnamed protein product, partial [Mesorhabditis belari]|uniref:Stonustoxin-like helical domain-containing protein n=1 Tax=Mesorhabditis belari TaxID=2138241 RepID=A0AAF3ELQ9_9BILA
MASNATIEMPCLGRPFHPGMLYDCRSDHLLPAITLWNPDNHNDMIVEDTIKEKSSQLGVDASLKLSLLGGMFHVEGSAHYFNDRKRSNKQCRVSLKYTSTSRYDQLSMGHFGPGDVQHPEVFDRGDATHVVTAVLYGADAVFVFDQEVNSSEDILEVGGGLKLAANIIIRSIEGEAKVKFSKGEKETYSKIHCHFHGDFSLEQNPRNLLEAINVYHQLPSIIQKNGPVPKKVWLYPLAKLDNRAAKLVRDISHSHVAEVEMVVEALYEAERGVNDLHDVCHSMFGGLKRQAIEFKQLLTEFNLDLKKKLLPILPKIRGGGASEQKLVDLLEQVQKSPFAPIHLQRWIEKKENEVNMLNYVIEQLKAKLIKADHNNIAITQNQAETQKIFQNFDNDLVLGLVFNVGGKPDSVMSEMKKYLCSQTSGPFADDIANLFQETCSFTNTSTWATNRCSSSCMPRIQATEISMYTHSFTNYPKEASANSIYLPPPENQKLQCSQAPMIPTNFHSPENLILINETLSIRSTDTKM